ncbi:hypothetical protein Zmor_023514 [Zophobas morio]|uniref:Uncharacterized protein n=1 Tax=Zophobas morio TaxID=2755281 RepID=A0AA38M7W4_9CUCU|nr:hypothetical protein Zmor_023514 [Zophobas morio]
MVYSVEQDTFIVMCCYRNGTFVNEERVYSVTACKQEYLAKYCDLTIQETSLEAHIKDVINRFVRTASVNKGKSPEDLEQSSYCNMKLNKGLQNIFWKLQRE